MQLTPHFSLEEMTKTSTGLDNEPRFEVSGNLIRLCEELMEPIRSMLDGPIVVHSGYRSPEVNKAVGGASNSAHLEGRACDFHPVGMNIRVAFDTLAASDLPFDKLIFEAHGSSYWIHAQVSKSGSVPRRKVYIAQVTDTGTAYKELK